MFSFICVLPATKKNYTSNFRKHCIGAEDDESFLNFTRMSIRQFDKLHEMVPPTLQKYSMLRAINKSRNSTTICSVNNNNTNTQKCKKNVTNLDEDASSVDEVVADDSAELFDTTFPTIFGLFGGRPFGRTGGLVFPPPPVAAAFPRAVTVGRRTSSSSSFSSSSVSDELSGEKILFFFESAAAAAAAAAAAEAAAILAIAEMADPVAVGLAFVLPAEAAPVPLDNPCNCCCCCLTTAGGALPPPLGATDAGPFVFNCFVPADDGGGGFFLVSVFRLVVVADFIGESSSLESAEIVVDFDEEVKDAAAAAAAAAAALAR